jgi:hypothetical protein
MGFGLGDLVEGSARGVLDEHAGLPVRVGGHAQQLREVRVLPESHKHLHLAFELRVPETAHLQQRHRHRRAAVWSRRETEGGCVIARERGRPRECC